MTGAGTNTGDDRQADVRGFRVALALALAGSCALAVAAVRSRWFWGGDLAPLLHVGEAVAMAAYALLGTIAMVRVAELAGRGAVSERTIVGGAAAIAVVLVIAPPWVSTDVYDYVARGRVEAVHGANPYTTAPAAFPDDPLTANSPAEWQTYVMPYGPIQAWVQAGIAWLNERLGGMAWLGAMLFAALHAAAHIGTGLLLAAARGGAAEQTDDRRRLLALWLWNPFVLLECVSSAHNEALMAFGLAWCCVGITRVSGAHTALGYAFAALTKHGVAPIAPLTAFWAWRRRRLPGYAAGVLIAGAVAALAAWRYWLEPDGLAWLGKQTENTAVSLQAALALAFGAELSPTLQKGGQLLALAVVLALGWRVRDAVSFGRTAALGTLTFLILAMPLFSAWYHLWWLPAFAACVPAVRSAPLLIAMGVLMPATYLPSLVTNGYGGIHGVWTWSLGLAAPTLLVLSLRQPRTTTHTGADDESATA